MIFLFSECKKYVKIVKKNYFFFQADGKRYSKIMLYFQPLNADKIQ